MRQPVPFGKYLLLDRVSVGGMAEVFKAKSYGVEGFEKVIAIKRILPSMGEDKDFVKMFIDEAKIAGQLNHANICQIFELGRAEGAHFIAMEFIWGKDLLQINNRLRRSNQVVPIELACFIIARVCEGLDYAHRKRDALGRPLQIVHRDCSPQNVLVSFEGEVKLIDFGIARAASRASRTMAGVLKGKFGYMSPEQVRGLPLDQRSDLFSVGTVLYESLTGERLFQGESDFTTLERVRNVDISPPSQLNPNIPRQLEAIVLKALAREPSTRYHWASELRDDLQNFLNQQPRAVTAKVVSAWLKQVFAQEHSKESKQLENYRALGRDGLIQGQPQAQANLDVVHYLGEAGEAEEPTVFGPPSFDDVVVDDERSQPHPAPAPPGLPSAPPGAHPRAQTPFQAHQPGHMPPQGGFAPPPGLPQMPPMHDGDPNSTELVRRVDTIPPPMGAAAGVSRPGEAFPRGLTGTSLAIPKARKNSTTRNILIGCAIAGVLLAIFLVIKLTVLDNDTPPEARGTLVVVIDGRPNASVKLDGKEIGTTSSTQPLSHQLPAGTYTVEVRTDNAPACKKQITIREGEAQTALCKF